MPPRSQSPRAAAMNATTPISVMNGTNPRLTRGGTLPGPGTRVALLLSPVSESAASASEEQSNGYDCGVGPTARLAPFSAASLGWAAWFVERVSQHSWLFAGLACVALVASV